MLVGEDFYARSPLDCRPNLTISVLIILFLLFNKLHLLDLFGLFFFVWAWVIRTCQIFSNDIRTLVIFDKVFDSKLGILPGVRAF